MYSKLFIWLSITFVISLGACDEESFRGGGSTKINPKTDSFDFPCDPVKKASYGKLTTAGSISSLVTVDGSFCSVSLDQKPLVPLSIFFVIDISGSMKWADNPSSGSCNRLDAARAVLNKVSPSTPIAGSKIQQQQVNVGLVTFAGSASVVGSSSLVPIDSFKSQLNSNDFCNTSGLSTNYEDAFDKTLEQLRNVSGSKIVYFISDGEPLISKSGSTGNAKEAGLNSAKNLRSLSDLTTYFLYLDDGKSSGNETPQQYLTRLAGGDTSKVRVVTNAADLANQAAQFETPDPLEFSGDSVFAVLTGPNGQQKKIEVIMNETNGVGQINFTTKPFIPFSGNLQQAIPQKLTVTVKASDGSSPSAVTDIIYTRDK